MLATEWQLSWKCRNCATAKQILRLLLVNPVRPDSSSSSSGQMPAVQQRISPLLAPVSLTLQAQAVRLSLQHELGSHRSRSETGIPEEVAVATIGGFQVHKLPSYLKLSLSVAFLARLKMLVSLSVQLERSSQVSVIHSRISGVSGPLKQSQSGQLIFLKPFTKLNRGIIDYKVLGLFLESYSR